MSVVTDYIKISVCVDVSNINISTFRQKIFVLVSEKKNTHTTDILVVQGQSKDQCCNKSVKVSKRSIKRLACTLHIASMTPFPYTKAREITNLKISVGPRKMRLFAHFPHKFLLVPSYVTVPLRTTQPIVYLSFFHTQNTKSLLFSSFFVLKALLSLLQKILRRSLLRESLLS